MTDIEKRAHQKYGTVVANKERTYNETLGKAYIQGATDQIKIEIEKACKWLYKSIPRIKEVYLDKDISERDKEDVLEDFKQAMEK